MAAKFKIVSDIDVDDAVSLKVTVDSDGDFRVVESTEGYLLLEITPAGVVRLHACMEDLEWVEATKKKNGQSYLPVEYA